MKMSYLRVRGGNLYYETAGEGPPLVLIHAGFLDSRMWDDQFQLFPKGARVIRYDVRGYGKSSQPGEEYSDAEDLFALLKHLNRCIVSVDAKDQHGQVVGSKRYAVNSLVDELVDQQDRSRNF